MVYQGKIIISGIRGMFLDMSEVVNKTPLSKEAFDGMNNLQYLKFYNSCFPRESEADCKFNFPDGLKLPLQEIRYFHWLKFPEEELPQHFNPKNLIDLKLPYSKIKRLWDSVKDTSNLKWVDLNHSVDLYDLSGLLEARNLHRLNLEGCTALKGLHERMQNLTSLVVLNLRGCTSLTYFVEMNMKSLKTLILSDCSNLEDFQVISEHLEALYLDGTALKRLPQSIIKLQRLVLLNMKDCKMLATVPDCLGNMKALQEVILSGCSRLESFPDLQENMRRLRIFLLDGTSIKEVPKLMQDPGLSEWPDRGVKGLPLLRHLCLRGNDMIKSLQPHIGQLYHLKYIDLKYCKNLMSVPTLPPNLQHLNAHGCESLTTLGNPLAFLVLTDQIHSTFIFSKCNKLDEVAKTSIISYIQKKSQLMSDAIDRYNLGSVVESFAGACFPGCEVPAWLSHQAYGSVIVLPELSRHWSNNGTTGVALCAVVSFADQNHRFLVKCTCEFKNADGSLRRFSCTVGGTEPHKIESDHVFIGYTSWLQIKKQKEQEDDKKGYSYSDDHYQASLRFEVTDGTGEVVKKCQVLKCGFSLVYESDETESVSWEVSSNPTDPTMGNINNNHIIHSESIVSAESQTMEEIIQHGETTSLADSNIHGASMSPADSEMEEIKQQGETSSTGDNIIHGVTMDVNFSDGSQRMEDTNQNGETSSCVSTEDQGYGSDVQGGESSGNDSLFSFTDNTSVQMIKPIGIICLVISISAGAAFMLGKRKRKR
uniref:Disease resistance protein RPS4 n=1 Tax=Noccaea caerulescens TaxID=107243 RepID=A0A1J3DHP0_NOCCA